ncbi:hypothetical protein L3X38_001663 [Prunus dulcis]|uniref:Transposable element protein n=2 Tax=Prunus dulcis TaxID=3755 RepID=A0AAD4WT31_PRUDU|nr:hypothetical protein L3X38_001663 [Prunus dulcis]
MSFFQFVEVAAAVIAPVAAVVTVVLPKKKKATEETSEEEDDEKAAAILVKDAKALGIIQNAVSDQICPRIANADSAKAAWELLYGEFHGGDHVRLVKLQNLIREFEYTRMHSESLYAYLTRLNDLINQMKTYGEVLSNERLVQKVLISLSKSNDLSCTMHMQLRKLLPYSQYKGKPKCYNCDRFGHLARECTAEKTVQKANCASQMEVSGNLFYANCATTKSKPNGDWYIDSGCSNHMTGNVDLLVDVRTNVVGKVQMPTGALVNVAGMGSLVIDTTKGRKYIREVMYLPGLKENLLSVGQMDEHGYCLVFGDGMCKVFESSLTNCLIIKVQMKKNRCYPLSFLVENQLLMKASMTHSTWTWHKRLGHLHFRGLKQLRDKDMVHGLPQLEEQNGVCEGCQLGKQYRNVFPKNQAQRASSPLELVHIDLCGPIKIESVAGNKYFMLIIDDCTRMSWVYLLRNKYEAFNCFKKFKSITELQSGHKVKCLRSDRGGEFLSYEFIKFCEDHGIQRQLTMAYTPQQNGVVERKNRTVVEMAKPFEAYSGRKPGIAHLKVFGSLCYVHVPNELRHKLEPKSVKGVFVGYATCEKGYRIFDPISKKLTLPRDVTFDEEGSWNWTEHHGKAVTPFPDESLSEHGFVIGDKAENVALTPQTQTQYERKCNLCIIEPERYAEAAQDKAWVKALEDELQMIENNGTWELVDRPTEKPVIGVKWVYKTKLNLDGSVQKNKARLVAKRYAQKPGLDYNETYAPVARLDTIRTLIALAAQKEWKLYQLDVKSAFLNGVLQEEVYIDQPEGYVIKGKEDKVHRLHKALYGLKQAPRAWYGEIDTYFMQCGFEKSLSEATLYTKTRGDRDILIVSIYVDDIVYTGSCKELLDEFKEEMMMKYEIWAFYIIFLAWEWFKRTQAYSFTQRINDDGSGAASEEQFRSIVGSLLNLTTTRPDIMYASSLLARFMHCPTNKHYEIAKRVLRYIKGTLDYGPKYVKGKNAMLIGFCDSDWGRSIDDSKSTSGYAFSFGSGVFSWASVKQNCVALSTAEAKYISASEATAQAIWLRFVLEDFGELQIEATPLQCDNTSAIAITKNPVFHQKTKHIDRRYHFIKDAL